MRRGISFVVLVMLFFQQLLPGIAWANEAVQSSVVDVTKLYTYEIMTEDIKGLAEKYPELISYQSIGKTPYGRDIWAVKLGKGDIPVLFDGSLHAREWISTVLLMKVIESYAESYTTGTQLEGYNIKGLLDKSCLWFLPMVNADGVTLQQFGPAAFPKEIQSRLLQMNDGKSDFKRWKANAQGIDLNQQYPADWENKDTKVYKPYYWNYKGSKPLEAPEAQAVVEFLKQLQPEILINYHSSGNMIYWHSLYTSERNLQRTRILADKVSAITGYRLVEPSTKPGAAGLMDYFLSHFDRPSLTIELNKYVGETNVPLENFPLLWEQNKTVPAFIAQEGLKLAEERKTLLQEIEKEKLMARQSGFASRHLNRLRYLYDAVEKNDVIVLVNGEKIETDVEPLLRGETLLIPIRAIAENLGASVKWDGALKEVTVTKDTTVIKLWVNKTTAIVNDAEYQLSRPAEILKGNVLVPLRFIGEALHLKVHWVPESRMVLVNE